MVAYFNGVKAFCFSFEDYRFTYELVARAFKSYIFQYLLSKKLQSLSKRIFVQSLLTAKIIYFWV